MSEHSPSHSEGPAKLVAYYRVSTKKQGESGLGMAGQVSAVEAYSQQTHASIIKAYKEVETGKRSDRTELAAALAHAKATRATLVIAKLDRLARDVHFLSGLMKGGTPFVCCDNPHATPLTIHILAAVAEDEAKRISARTKAALGAYRAEKRVSKRIRERYPDGVPAEVVAATAGKLGAELVSCRNLSTEARRKGAERGSEANAARAADAAGPVLAEALALRREVGTLRKIAAGLNALGYVTRRGKPWTAPAVWRLLGRYEQSGSL
jgi:DNA invertase Pin-like site-specific DNA recombinase